MCMLLGFLLFGRAVSSEAAEGGGGEKYLNEAPKTPSKEATWLNDMAIPSMQTFQSPRQVGLIFFRLAIQRHNEHPQSLPMMLIDIVKDAALPT